MDGNEGLDMEGFVVVLPLSFFFSFFLSFFPRGTRFRRASQLTLVSCFGTRDGVLFRCFGRRSFRPILSVCPSYERTEAIVLSRERELVYLPETCWLRSVDGART